MKLSQLDILILGAQMAKGKDDHTAEKLYARAREIAIKKYGALDAITGLIVMELQQLLEKRGAESESEQLAGEVRAIFTKSSESLPKDPPLDGAKTEGAKK